MLTRKGFGLRIAAVDAADDHATFTGTALVYGERDSLGDSIRAGCFTRSLAAANNRLPLLWNHDSGAVLGTIDVTSDARELTVTGRLLTSAVAKSVEVYELLKAGAVKGLSVGFLPMRREPSGAGVEFTEGRLCEVSLTAVPAFASAQVIEVRGMDAAALKELRTRIDAELGEEPEDPAVAMLKALNKFDPRKWNQRVGRMG